MEQLTKQQNKVNNFLLTGFKNPTTWFSYFKHRGICSKYPRNTYAFRKR